MAGVEDGSETDTRLERLDNHSVDVIIDNVSIRGMVDRVDDFIITVLFVAVEVLSLATVT